MTNRELAIGQDGRDEHLRLHCADGVGRRCPAHRTLGGGQAVALGLGSVVVGAFDDGRVKTLVNLAESEQPLSIVPVGRRVGVAVPVRPGS